MTDQPETDGQRTGPRHPELVEPLLDIELRMLINLVEKDEEDRSHFGVSLNIPGGVIYGSVISRSAYARVWESELRGLPGAGAESLARLPRLINEVLQEERAAGTVAGATADPLPRWVHLRDAHFLTGSSAQTMHYALWRGRLADVVGWSLSIPSPPDTARPVS
ncbi:MULTISPECIES: hypothetical protein [unclassified Streptomyces]|uniref:hypothetical protein n=1 Tax=unclassified Streptomyces TaxID=2593676 RepID=UPI0036482ACB